jgi:hypothetical protein
VPLSPSAIEKIGGRSVSAVPSPGCWWARRWGGSCGSQCGLLSFPRLLIQLSGFKDLAPQHLPGLLVLEVLLHPQAERVRLLAREFQLPCQSRRAFAFGHPAQEQHEMSRGLAPLGEDGPGEQRVVTITGLTPLAGERLLARCRAPPLTLAIGAGQARGMELVFQPAGRGCGVEQLSDGKVNQVLSLLFNTQSGYT